MQFRATLFPIVAVLALCPAATAAPDHHHASDTAWGRPGDPRQPSRVVQIVMREVDGRMLFIPSRVEVRRGEQVRFMLRNNGELDHEIVLATAEENLRHAEAMKTHPGMAHDEPNAKRLGPDKTGEILWQFTHAGTFDFSCLIPGHREAGMSGTVIVK
jgi:uncharacterized cupredoxin-like copper-binding protein